MRQLAMDEIDHVDGGVSGWAFAGAVAAGAGATIAICTAPAWGAIGGVLVLGSITFNMLDRFSQE